MAVVKGRVEPIKMVQGSSSNGTGAVAAPGHIPVAAAVPIVFTVDNQVVSFDGRFQVIAAEGDEILIVGKIKDDGILHATAYENLTRAVGKTGILPSLVMTSLYVSLVLIIPFFFWAMLEIGAEFSDPVFMLLAIGTTASVAAPTLIIRAYNQRMKRDAQELADYARDHLLSRRD
jgi:hypothetical protein